uniref:Ig-like domain-containing protein n=1 Tax=Sinocyclocheilus anshuiensis TaxID=1608454 RepID=A0A671RD60_9TELE
MVCFVSDNVKLGPDGAVLTITNVRLSNQGGYRCIATNAQGKETNTASLTIRQPLKVHVTPSEPLSVHAGESVTLECSVTGKPRPSISWTKQGSEAELVSMTTDATASLQQRMLRYLCAALRAEGGLTEGRVELRLEGGASAGVFPQASVTETDLTAVEGQSISMHCHATGSPTAVISWSKLRAPLPWQHKVSGGSLTLNNVGHQDSGQYLCNATNALGFSEAYVQLEVDYFLFFPRITPNALNVLLMYSGHVLKVWDSGTYKCVATNHVGSSEAVTIRAIFTGHFLAIISTLPKISRFWLCFPVFTQSVFDIQVP